MYFLLINFLFIYSANQVKSQWRGPGRVTPATNSNNLIDISFKFSQSLLDQLIGSRRPCLSEISALGFLTNVVRCKQFSKVFIRFSRLLARLFSDVDLM